MKRKLRYMIGSKDVCVFSPDDESGNYWIYTEDSHILWFVLMIPIFGNLIALIGWICSLSRKVYFEDSKGDKSKKDLEYSTLGNKLAKG